MWFLHFDGLYPRSCILTLCLEKLLESSNNSDLFFAGLDNILLYFIIFFDNDKFIKSGFQYIFYRQSIPCYCQSISYFDIFQDYTSRHLKRKRPPEILKNRNDWKLFSI